MLCIVGFTVATIEITARVFMKSRKDNFFLDAFYPMLKERLGTVIMQKTEVFSTSTL
jgi:hypothetical protein